MSHAAMQMKLYATAINFFVASIDMQKDNKCLFRRNLKHCMSYNFDKVISWYVSKHNYGLLNQNETDFDSAVFYPYRIKSGWFDFLKFFVQFFIHKYFVL